MKRETLEIIKRELEETSIYSLFKEKIGEPESVENEDSKSYALMFDFEKDELFFLSYATNENSWNKTAESQNPWITISFVSATDILTGDPAGDILIRLEEEIEQQEQMQLYSF